MDSCGRMDRVDTPVGREDDREETNYAFSSEIDDCFVEDIEKGKQETGLEKESEVEGSEIGNVNTDECIKDENIKTEEDLKHADDKVAMFDIYLVENEYSEMKAHIEKEKDAEYQLHKHDHKKEESVVEGEFTESVLDENYNSLTILTASLEKPGLGIEIRKLFSTNIYLIFFKSKYKKHALWFLFIFSGLILTLRMVSMMMLVCIIIS
jgi:hypothetical protein